MLGLSVRRQLLGLLFLAPFAATAAAAAPPSGAPVAGIRCEGMEGTALHTHQHLAIFDHGARVVVPEDVGRPIAAPCFYWLHTHTDDGIVHIESPVARQFTLGDFFSVWDMPLSRSAVAGAKARPRERVVVWVNGRRYAGNVRNIPLFQHTEVTIEVGPPYTKPAPFTGWGGL